MLDPQKIFIAGNLSANPQWYKNSRGRGLCLLLLAINRFSYEEGQWTKRACEHSVLVGGEQAALCHTHLEAGSPLAVEGYIDSAADTGPARKTTIVAEQIHFLGLRTMTPLTRAKAPDLGGPGDAGEES